MEYFVENYTFVSDNIYYENYLKYQGYGEKLCLTELFEKAMQRAYIGLLNHYKI